MSDAPEDPTFQAPPDVPPQEASQGSLVQEFQERRKQLDLRLDSIQELIQDLRRELQGDSEVSIHRLAQAAQDMANGRVYQKIDIEAKGELGALVSSLNQTLLNLQQLDASVKHQSTQVPELAAQLDAITTDTEEATQNVMNRLDTLMASCDEALKSIVSCEGAVKAQQARQTALQEAISGFLDRAAGGEDRTTLTQEVFEFLFAHQMEGGGAQPDLGPVQAQLRQVGDEAFEILNVLQFQDITRQKIEKVVLLLKQFQTGLTRLLVIFNIHTDALAAQGFGDRRTATQDRIFDTSLEADSRKDSVDDIIAQFKQAGGN
ncbi:MAG TPA: methyl-accepting chemotaxis protein [Holophagaceae bacterium]